MTDKIEDISGEQPPLTEPESPPFHYMRDVTEHCPKAARTYMELWVRKDKDYMVRLRKTEIRAELLISMAKFRHDLMLLVSEGLATVDETITELKIELTAWY